MIVPRCRFDGPVRPLLSYQCAIDALGPAADPSHTLRRGDQVELPFIAMALRRGWAVVTTDFNGPDHAFGTLPLAGRLVVDGIRAAVALGPAAGLGPATPIGLWGYSGGGLATLAAVERHALDASDLAIVGAAAGGAGIDVASSPEMFEAGGRPQRHPLRRCRRDGPRVPRRRSRPGPDPAGPGHGRCRR